MPAAPKAPAVRVEVFYFDSSLNGRELRFVVAGRPVDAQRLEEPAQEPGTAALSPSPVWSFDVAAAGGDAAAPKLPEIAVEAHDACGWAPLYASPELLPPEAVRRERGPDAGSLARITLRSNGPAGNRTSLWIDNRNGPASKVTIGEVELPLEAGFHGTRQVPTGSCTVAVPVQLDGRPIGELSVEKTASPGIAAGPDVVRVVDTLLDVSGARCYASRKVEYGPQDALLPSGSGGRSATVRIQAGRLHALAEAPDFFLEPAPAKVEVATDPRFGETGSATRLELREVACGH